MSSKDKERYPYVDKVLKKKKLAEFAENTRGLIDTSLLLDWEDDLQ